MKPVTRMTMGLCVAWAALIIALFPLAPQVDAADSDGYQEYSLGEIVVKGKGSAARDIAVINEIRTEDFEAVNAASVADALTHVPGVQVTYGRKQFPSVSIRGFDQNRILTLIDGVPYYETKYGGMDLNQIGLTSVARIDVVKGAPSVLYGPNALGGVVNIITRQPTEKPYLSATAEYGVDGLEDAYKVSLSHGMKVGKFNYWLSYAHREWDAWDLSKDYEPRVGQIRRRPGGTTDTVIENGGTRQNSDYKTDNVWGKVGLEPSERTEIYANFHYIKSEKGDPPNVDRVNVFSDFSQFDRITAYDDWGVDLSAKHAFSPRFELQAKLFYHYHEDEYTSYSDQTYTEKIALSTYKDSILGGMLLGEYRPIQWNALRCSLHYKRDTHEQRDLERLPYAESVAYTGSVGLENETTLFKDKLAVVVGASYDWYNIDKAQDDSDNDGNIVDWDTPSTSDEFNPMLGLTYRAGDTTQLFASVAKKTRFPTLSQLYSGDIPNLDLKAEKAINYTVGVAWRYRQLLNIEVAPFYHDISDFITRDVPPEQNPYSQYINYDEIDMKGVEVNALIAPLRDLSFKLGYMYNNATNRSPGRISDDVLGVPEYTFNVGLQYTLPTIGTRLNLTLLYMGESYRQLPTPEEPDLEIIKNKGYQLCNIKITQPLLADHLELFLAVDNLFDDNYEPVRGYPAPGISAWLGLTLRL